MNINAHLIKPVESLDQDFIQPLQSPAPTCRIQLENSAQPTVESTGQIPSCEDIILTPDFFDNAIQILRQHPPVNVSSIDMQGLINALTKVLIEFWVIPAEGNIIAPK